MNAAARWARAIKEGWAFKLAILLVAFLIAWLSPSEGVRVLLYVIFAAVLVALVTWALRSERRSRAAQQATTPPEPRTSGGGGN